MRSSPILFDCQGLNCRLVRSKRRTIGISVSADRIVTVRVPQRFPKKLAPQVVMQQLGWIQKRLADYAAAVEKPLAAENAVTLLGRPFQLKQAEKAGFTADALLLPKGVPDQRQAIAEACQMLALQVFTERTMHFAPLLGIRPEEITKIAIGRSNSSWGSCRAGGQLRFSWKALFCSSRDVDYLTVHELCHLRHMDHSPAFWKMVETAIPDWRECRERMKNTSRQIKTQNWQQA